MLPSLRHHATWDENSAPRTHARKTVSYRFEFVGVEPLPLSDHVYRETPVAVDTVELYGARPYWVESVDHEADPPVAVLRKVRS